MASRQLKPPRPSFPTESSYDAIHKSKGRSGVLVSSRGYRPLAVARMVQGSHHLFHASALTLFLQARRKYAGAARPGWSRAL